MSRELALYEVAYTILNGDGVYGDGIYGAGSYGSVGVALARAGPGPAGVQWIPTYIVISTPSQSIPQFFLYANYIDQSTLIAATINGNAYQVPYAGPNLYTGQSLIGRWLGGDAGVQATMTITGTKKVPGQDQK